MQHTVQLGLHSYHLKPQTKQTVNIFPLYMTLNPEFITKYNTCLLKKTELTSVLARDEIDMVSELSLVFGVTHEVLEAKSLDDACCWVLKSWRNPRTGFSHALSSSPFHSCYAMRRIANAVTQLNFIEFKGTEVGAKKTHPLGSMQQKQEKLMEAKVSMAGRKKGVGLDWAFSLQLLISYCFCVPTITNYNTIIIRED